MKIEPMDRTIHFSQFNFYTIYYDLSNFDCVLTCSILLCRVEKVSKFSLYSLSNLLNFKNIFYCWLEVKLKKNSSIFSLTMVDLKNQTILLN